MDRSLKCKELNRVSSIGFIRDICPMRIIGEIAHPELKITIFHWNNKYLIKLEVGLFEQTYKIHEYDVANEEEVKKLVTEEFIKSALERFNQMADSLHKSLSNL